MRFRQRTTFALLALLAATLGASLLYASDGSSVARTRQFHHQRLVQVEGRKAHSEVNPTTVALAKRLHRANPKTGERISLRRIGAALEKAGHVSEYGRPFNPNSIKSMVERKATRSIALPPQ